MTDKLHEQVADLPRYEPQGEPNHHNGAAWMAEDAAGEWIRRDDVLAALEPGHAVSGIRKIAGNGVN